MMKKTRFLDTFSMKIFLFNMLVLTVVSGILFTVFVSYYVSVQEENIDEQLESQLLNMENSMNIMVDNMEVIATQVGISPVIRSSFQGVSKTKGINDLENNILLKQQLYEYLFTYVIKRDNIDNVRIFNEYNDYLSVGILESDEMLAMFQSAEYAQSIEVLFEETKEYSIYQTKAACNSESGNSVAISVLREIKDDVYKIADSIGYVEVEVTADTIKKNLKNILWDNTKYIIYDNVLQKNILSNVEIEEDMVYEEQALKAYFQNDMYIESSSIGASNITIMVMQSRNENKKYLPVVLLSALGAYCILLAVLMYIQKQITKTLTKPLVQLCESVKNKGVEVLTDMPKLDMDGEFEVLSYTFNSMMNTLHESMELVVSAKTGEVKAQLFALQSQMSPHFIHNTLAVIQAYSNEGNSETVNIMCDKLSQIIRYGSNYTKSKIKLEDELKHAQNYVDLVKFRYEDNVEFQVEYDKEMGKIQVPRFILQPIIENSFEHGVKNKRFPWKILVNIEESDNKWKVHICDNGVGMSTSEIEKIKNYIDIIKSGDLEVLNENLKIGGLSIKNIIGRLYLEYRENMVVEIKSQIGEYTEIVIGGDKE